MLARRRTKGGRTTKRTILAVLIAGAAAFVWYYVGSTMTPRGQEPLVTLGANDLNPVKTLFNTHRDKKRVMVLLSPTCGKCLEGASAVQRTIATYTQSDLIVMLIWEPIIPTDRIRPGAAILGRLSDPRARQYWDPQHLVAGNLAESMAKNKSFPRPGCCVTAGFYWDLVAVFPKGSEWTEDLPAATFIQGPVADFEQELSKALK